MKKLILITLLFSSIAEAQLYGPRIQMIRNPDAVQFDYRQNDAVDDDYFAEYLNTPYVYGGSNSGGIDCSAFVQKIFLKRGIKLPRTSLQQYRSANLVTVDIDDLKKWDLLFFKKWNEDRVSHVAIYIGNGKMIHSSKNEGGVSISNFKGSRLWQRLFYAAKRVRNFGGFENEKINHPVLLGEL